jgi:hypothetical protein
MARVWRRGFDAILDEVDELTAGRDVAVGLVGDRYIFLSDTSIIRAYGLPADFALDIGELLIREQPDAMAGVAQQHDAEFVDVWRIFNGPAHDNRGMRTARGSPRPSPAPSSTQGWLLWT